MQGPTLVAPPPQQQPHLAGLAFADQPKCRRVSDQLRRSLRHGHILGTVDTANWQRTRRGDGVKFQRASGMEAAPTWTRARRKGQKRDASGQSLIPGPLPLPPCPLSPPLFHFLKAIDALRVVSQLPPQPRKPQRPPLTGRPSDRPECGRVRDQ